MSTIPSHANACDSLTINCLQLCVIFRDSEVEKDREVNTNSRLRPKAGPCCGERQLRFQTVPTWLGSSDIYESLCLILSSEFRLTSPLTYHSFITQFYFCSMDRDLNIGQTLCHRAH